MAKRKRSDDPCNHLPELNSLSNTSHSPLTERTGATSIEAPDSRRSSQQSGLHDSDISGASSASSLPLTEENLKRFDRNSMSPKAGPTTPGKRKGTTASSTNAASIREILQRNNCLVDDEDGAKVGEKLIQGAQAILNGERGSAMKEETSREIKLVLDEHKTANELTFLTHLWDILHSKTRHVKKEEGMTDDSGRHEGSLIEGAARQGMSFEERVEYVRRAWSKDDLQTNWNAAFPSDAVPRLRAEDPSLQELLASTPRVQDSQPDLSYGLKAKAFSRIQQDKNESYGTELGSRNYHVFFCIEAKSWQGILLEAENQCARAGAAMVNTRRKFNNALDPPATQEEKRNREQTPGADADSFAFTLAITPDGAEMFVNWHERRVSPRDSRHLEDVWHMHFLDEYRFRFQESYDKLRHDMNNVLDWGVGARKLEIRAAIDAAEQRATEERAPKRQRVDQNVEERSGDTA